MLANEKGMKSVAFPAISCGVYGYPLHDAAKVLCCAAFTACSTHWHSLMKDRSYLDKLPTYTGKSRMI